MKKTLVIHPLDDTTTMLEHIYKDKNYTVLRDPNVSEETLREQIANHEKIIFLGHGLADGLINPLVRENRAAKLFILSHAHAHLLKDKETVSIWCYSDAYFRRHNLSGFHTGMIISEQMEAQMVLGYSPLSSQELYDNMVRFAKIVGECIDEDAETMKAYVLAHYDGNDDITRFNRQNIIVLV